MANILMIGCGAIGMCVARILAGQGHVVTVLKRSPPNAESGINYVVADITSAAAINNLAIAVDVVFFMVSADARTERCYRDIYQFGLQNVLAKYTGKPWFFVSSTSVYGQSQGEWVDEEAPVQPDNACAQLIVEAEQRVMALNPENVVVRFSGIYGPGREYLLRMARQSPAIQQTPPYFTNRIHQQDCIGILVFLLQQRLAGVALQQCYLASDDDPAPLWDVVSWLAEKMHCSPPIAKEPGQDAVSNKRCANRRLKTLGYQFHYSGYKDGYRELAI